MPAFIQQLNGVLGTKDHMTLKTYHIYSLALFRRNLQISAPRASSSFASDQQIGEENMEGAKLSFPAMAHFIPK